MNFSDFYGMDALVGRLKRGVGGQSVHAYLFYGPSGTGKRSLAEICARALNCTGAGERPCDRCPSCARYLEGVHPDHIVLGGDKALGVLDVRDLTRRIFVRPFEGGRHTVILNEADRMTVQAQNALLKTLEEPPGDTVFFLIARGTAQLLPTILSRTRPIRFAPLPDVKVAEALRKLGVDEGRIGALSRAAQGSVGKALELSSDEGYWALRERVISALSALKTPADVAAAFARVKDDKGDAPAVYDLLEEIARASMRAFETGAAMPEGVPEIVRRGDGLLRGVFLARAMQKSNVSFQSIMETIFLNLSLNAKEHHT